MAHRVRNNLVYTVLLKDGGRLKFTPSAFKENFSKKERDKMIADGTVVIESIITEPNNLPIKEDS